jgi:hypothetical protein
MFEGDLASLLEHELEDGPSLYAIQQNIATDLYREARRSSTVT